MGCFAPLSSAFLSSGVECSCWFNNSSRENPTPQEQEGGVEECRRGQKEVLRKILKKPKKTPKLSDNDTEVLSRYQVQQNRSFVINDIF